MHLKFRWINRKMFDTDFVFNSIFCGFILSVCWVCRTKAKSYLFHVVSANLLICMFTIPTEIGWRWTIEWRGGNIGCKLLQFFRVLGLYALSHNLTAVAVDKVVQVRQLDDGRLQFPQQHTLYIRHFVDVQCGLQLSSSTS